jgi:transposase
MKINSESKVTMNAVNGEQGVPASQGARRATEDAGAAADVVAPSGNDGEVVAVARRRQFSNADKRRILLAAERCTKPGELGALMRREGVYSSSLSTWRRQRDAADLAALAPQKRGPKIDPSRADGLQIAQLIRDNERLKNRLDKALLVIEVQKKVATLLGLASRDDSSRTSDGQPCKNCCRS